MSQVGDTPNSRTASDHQEGVNHGSPSTNELCIKLIEEFTNGRISKDKAIQEIINTFWESDAHGGVLAIQIQMAVSAYIVMFDWAGLLNRMQLNEGEDSVWNHWTLEEQIQCPLLSWIKPLNWKQAWEEELLTKDSSPGPEKKIQKLILSPAARNSPESSSTTTWLTSKSQSTIYSVCGLYLSSLTLSGSKYYRGKQLTWTSLSPWSTPPLQTTEPLSHLDTLNFDLGTWSQHKQSKTTETGLSCTVCSNVQYGLSTHTGKASSSTMGNASQHISPLQMQPDRDESSTLTKWSSGGLDQSTTFPLTNFKNSDSLRCGTFSEKLQGIWTHRGCSKQEEARNKGVDLHGEAGMLADCLTKESAWDKWVIANTGMCVLCTEGMAMSKRNAQQERLKQIEEWERPRWVRVFLWEVGEGDIGLTTLYSLTMKPLLHPGIAATKDKVRIKTICACLDLFKIICQIRVDTFKWLLTHHLNWPFVDSVIIGL